MLCDFCSAPDPVLAFDARDFILPEFGNDDVAPESVGGWCACAACGELVANRDWQALAERAATSLLVKYPDFPATCDELAEQFYGLYAGMLSGQLTGGISAQKGMASA